MNIRAEEPVRTGRRRPRGGVAPAIATAAATLALAGCVGLPAPTETESAVPSPTPSPRGTSAVQDEAMSIPDIVRSVQPSVVTIFTEGGLGSGVVYQEDGLILTNEHVVRGNTRVEVAFADGQRVDGEVTATDPITDLALVQADREDLPAAEFAESLPVIGELAVVIGSPLGFENTATSGIVSGLHREIPGSASSSQSLVDLIQTDAAISPGNSGGAVVNGRGQIIGISEAYIPPSAGAVALGFAIPSPTATEVAEELIEDGTADHAFLGLVPGAITPQIAEQLGLTDTTGAIVLSVSNGGPAAAAGIRPGDVVTAIEGNEIGSPEDLLAALRQQDPGDRVTVDVRRGGDEESFDVTLTDRPSA